MYFEAPFINLICKRWPKFRRWSAPLGLVIIVLALVASSYAKHVSHLILTQGILYAIGGGLMYVPNNIFIDEWFVKRKGFAFGVNMVSIPCTSFFLKAKKSNWIKGRQRSLRRNHSLCNGMGPPPLLATHHAPGLGSHSHCPRRPPSLLRQTPSSPHRYAPHL